MSYRLINANDLNGKISEEDYKVVLNAPCIYADLPNGLDGEYHEASEWIPVSERLPEEGARVIVTQIFGERTTVYCTIFPFEKTKEKYITAWMPLPEPYKAESEE